MKIAACYIRVSTEDQLEYSPDAQLRELRRYAASHDFYIDSNHIYIDEGISGRKTKNRTAFLRMITAAKSKPRPFDVILLWKFSRFARNREDAIVYKSMLRKLGIEVVSITESVGDDKMSVIVEAMIEAMDEYYSLNLGEEVRRGMTEKALRGGVQTTPPLGYDKPKDSPGFIINTAEAATVRQIFQLYMAGHSFTSIARRLNAQGQRTKRGNAFDMRQIEYIINNPVYKGFLRWTPTKTVGLRIYDSPDTITVPGGHTPIIDAETWDKAHELYLQKSRQRKPHERAADTKKHYLSGLLFCGHCGGKLTYNAHYNGFQCWRYSKGLCATSCYASAGKLEDEIITALQELAGKSRILTYTKKTSSAATPTEITILHEELKSLQKIIDKAHQAYLAGIDTLEEYGTTKRQAQQRIEKLQKQIAVAPQTQPQTAKIDLDSACAIIKSDRPPAAKNAALVEFMDKIIVTRKPVADVKIILR